MVDEPRKRVLLAQLEKANATPRCGARARHTGGRPCKAPSLANGRCRHHGGKSTGPKTAEGLERSRKANWKHGRYSREVKADRIQATRALRLLRQLLAQIK
jgi:hypothetical protein